MNQPAISFEFFPPKNEEVEKQLWAAVPELIALAPKFMTVTYGAGGSTKDGTLAALTRMRGMTQIPLASHLTFLSTTKADLDSYIEKLWNLGIRHLVALRGDLPKGTSFDDFKGSDYYDYTSNFIITLKKRHPFEITVGAYPEKHPDAPSLDADIEALKLKCEAGADRAVTQFFFDNDIYFRFAERCEKAGITTPIYPGILPIYDFAGIQRFAARCDASIPAWLHEKFAGLEHKPEEALKVAQDIFVTQTQALADAGVGHIHFYTMNKAPLTVAACEVLGYRAKAA